MLKQRGPSNKTKSDIKQRALEELGVVQIGQSAESQHDQRIGDAYIEVYNDLKTEGLATWSETGTIPNDIVPHLIDLVTLNGVNSFSISNDRYTRIVNKTGVDGEKTKRQIRSIVTPDYESLENPENF